MGLGRSVFPYVYVLQGNTKKKGEKKRSWHSLGEC